MINRSKADLLPETFQSQARRDFWMQNLQRHRAIVTTILGEEDGGKAAASELTIDSVVVGERLFQAVVSRHGSGATLPALGPGLKRINAEG